MSCAARIRSCRDVRERRVGNLSGPVHAAREHPVQLGRIVQVLSIPRRLQGNPSVPVVGQAQLPPEAGSRGRGQKLAVLVE